MAELSNLHVKITGDNSSYKTAVQGSIGITDQFGNKLTNQANVAAAAQSKQAAAHAKTRAAIVSQFTAGKKLTTAYTAQRMSTTQLTAATTRMTGGLKLSGAAADLMTKRVRNSRFHTANLGAQFNDIFVMMAAGQNPLMLAAQQGTQITQVFSAMGGGPRDNVMALWDALKKVVSVTSLVTLGVIAGGAALFQWATQADDAEESADMLTQRMEAAREASAALTAELAGIRMGVDDKELAFMDKRLAIEQTVLELREKLQAATTRQNADQRAIDEQKLAAAEESLDLATEELKAYREQVAEKERLLNAVSALADQEREVWEAANAAKEETAENKELVRLMGEGLKAATIQAMQLAGVDIAAGVKEAQLAAAQLSQDLNISFQAARDMLALQGTMRYSGRGGTAQFDDARGVFKPTAETEDAADNLLNPSSRRGRTPTNTTPRDFAGIEQELRSPAEQLEFELEEKRKIMQAAFEQELVDKQTHDSMLEQIQQAHSDKMLDIARLEADAKLAGWSGAFGDLASLADSENKRLAAVGRAAGLIQIGIDGVRAASSAWEKGMAIGGPPTAAAFAGASVIKTAALMGQMRASNPNPSGASGGGAASGATGGSGGSAGGGQQPLTTFSFSIQNDSLGIGDNIVRQIVDQLNANSRNGGRIRGVIT